LTTHVHVRTYHAWSKFEYITYIIWYVYACMVETDAVMVKLAAGTTCAGRHALHAWRCTCTRAWSPLTSRRGDLASCYLCTQLTASPDLGRRPGDACRCFFLVNYGPLHVAPSCSFSSSAQDLGSPVSQTAPCTVPCISSSTVPSIIVLLFFIIIIFQLLATQTKRRESSESESQPDQCIDR